MERKQVKRYIKTLNLLWVILSLLILIAFVALILPSRCSIFQINAEIEQVQFKAEQELFSGWHLNNVTVRESIFSDSLFSFSGTIKLHVEIQKEKNNKKRLVEI